MAFDPDKWLSENPPPEAAAMPGTGPGEQKDDRPWGDKAKDMASYYEKMLRLGTNAATFGMADRFAAGGEALTGGAPSYAEALKKERDISETIARENPHMAVAADVLGGAAGGMGLARLGATTAGRMVGQPLWRRTAAAGAESALQGGAQGAGNTYTGNPMDYVSNAGTNAAIGGVLGLPAPAVGAVAGSAWKGLENRGYFGTVPGAVAQAANTDAAGLATLQNRGARAMLPDAGPSLKGLAQGAVLPEKGGGGAMGPGQAALERNLTTRDASMPQEITGQTNQIFGPATTPSRSRDAIRARMEAMGPEYDAALNQARAVDTQALANRLDTLAIDTVGDTRAAVQRVRAMLDIADNPGVLDPHPRKLQAVRTEVRAMANDPALNRNTRGLMETVERDLTRELQDKVPGIRELDSRYAEFGTREAALETTSPGSRAFVKDRESVIRPEEMPEILREAATPKGTNIGPSLEPIALREAARAELDRIVGTNKNDLLALENLLGRPGDYNIDKLATIFGRERADRLMNVLESERVFRESFQDIVKNSQTAKRQASEKALDASTGKIPAEASLFGSSIRGLQWAKDKMMATSAAANRDRIAGILATNDPQQLQAMIPRLLAAEPDRERRAAMVRNLIQSGWVGGSAAAPLSITVNRSGGR